MSSPSIDYAFFLLYSTYPSNKLFTHCYWTYSGYFHVLKKQIKTDLLYHFFRLPALLSLHGQICLEGFQYQSLTHVSTHTKLSVGTITLTNTLSIMSSQITNIPILIWLVFLERFYTTDHSFILKQVPFIASLCKNVCFSSKLSRYSLSVCYLNPFSSDQNLSNSSVITQDLESSFFPHLCTPYMILIHSTVSIPTYKQITQNFISSVQT